MAGIGDDAMFLTAVEVTECEAVRAGRMPSVAPSGVTLGTVMAG
jgi:hypothetical protein